MKGGVAMNNNDFLGNAYGENLEPNNFKACFANICPFDSGGCTANLCMSFDGNCTWHGCMKDLKPNR